MSNPDTNPVAPFPSIPLDCSRKILSYKREIEMHRIRKAAVLDIQNFIIEMFDNHDDLKDEKDEYVIESYCNSLVEVSVFDISSFVDLIDAVLSVESPSDIHVALATVISNIIRTVFDGRYGLDPKFDRGYFVRKISYFNEVL